LPRASSVATSRWRDRLWLPRKARRYVWSAAPAPSQEWPWSSRRPSPSSGPIRGRRDGPWHGLDDSLGRSATHRYTTGCGRRQVCDDEPMTRPPVRVVAHPQPRLARLTRDQMDDGRPIIGVGAVACALVRTAAGRIIRGAVGRAFFPPPSGITRPSQRRCPSSGGWGPSYATSSEGAAAGYGAACATAQARGPAGPSARLWPHRAAGASAWPVVAAFWRRRSRSAASSRCGKPDNDRRESGPAPRHNRHAVLLQRGQCKPSGWRCRSHHIRETLLASNSIIGKSIMRP